MLFLDREGKHPVGDINCSVFLEQMNNCEMFLVAVYVYEEMRTIFWPWINLECPVLPSIAYSWGSCWHSHPRGQGRRSSRQLHACRKDRESWSMSLVFPTHVDIPCTWPQREADRRNQTGCHAQCSQSLMDAESTDVGEVVRKERLCSWQWGECLLRRWKAFLHPLLKNEVITWHRERGFN